MLQEKNKQDKTYFEDDDHWTRKGRSSIDNSYMFEEFKIQEAEDRRSFEKIEEASTR